jgi:predicted nucleotidyltransferase
MENVKELTKKILPILLPYGIKRIAIFGSFARGEVKQESDIDILIDFTEPRKVPIGLLSWIRLERKLSQVLGRKVDLVSSAGLRKDFKDEIEKELIVIYEKEK